MNEGEVIYSPIPHRNRKGRPKVEGAEKEWDIRLTPSDQLEVNFDSLEMEDFKILLVCKEGEPNGQPRLHYHMYMKTTRADSYIDNLLNKLGKATATVKGNAIFSKRKSHEGTIGYVVKGGEVVVRHGINDTYLTEIFKRSEDYRKDKEKERKRASRGDENFLGSMLKELEVKRLSDPLVITQTILAKYSELGKRFPAKSQLEGAVMSVIYKTDPDQVIRFYARNMVNY